MADLGKNLQYDCLLLFIKRIGNKRASLEALLAFAIGRRAVTESANLASILKETIMRYKKSGLVLHALRAISDERYDLLAPILELDLPRNFKAADVHVWWCMSAEYDSLMLPRYDAVADLRYAALVGNTKYYLDYFTYHPSEYPFSADFDVAFITGNVEIVTFLAQKNRSLLGDPQGICWGPGALTMKMVNLFISLKINLKRSRMTCTLPFWSPDQREAVKILIQNGCNCTEEVRQALQ
jgi:hypothetical protein